MTHLPLYSFAFSPRLKPLFALACLASAHLASAQSMGFAGGPPMTQDFEVNLGVAAASMPEYLGSDKNSTKVLPLISARWKNGAFASIQGVGMSYPVSDKIKLGAALRLDAGRKESDSEHLNGMGDIKSRPELVGFAAYAFNPAMNVETSLAYGSGNEKKGLLFKTSARMMMPVSADVKLALNASVTMANANAMQEQFGVTAAQASTSAYAAYTPSAGLRDASLGANLIYSLTPTVSLMAGVTATRLLGAANSSPLTHKASSISGLMGIQYRF